MDFQEAILLSSRVTSFLELDSVYRLSAVNTNCYLFAEEKRLKKNCLRINGLPKRLRIRYYSSVTGVSNIFPDSAAKLKCYRNCLGNRRGMKQLRETGSEGEILRDIPRTYPNRPLFDPAMSLGQDILSDILRAVAVYDSVCGYCQGMNYVAATLILICIEGVLADIENNPKSCSKDKKLCSFYKKESMEEFNARMHSIHHHDHGVSGGVDSSASSSSTTIVDEDHDGTSPPLFYMTGRDEELESDVFGLMIGFINNFDMRDLWRPGVPQLKLRIYQFDRVLSLKMSRLHAHFREIGLSSDFFASQWFLTLLAYNLGYEDLVRCWDVLFTDGWKTLFRTGIAILSSLEEDLIELTMENTGRYFRAKKGLGGEVLKSIVVKTYNNNSPTTSKTSSSLASQVVQFILKQKVTTRVLMELEREYVHQVLQRQLSEDPDRFGTVSFVDRRVADHVREEINSMDKPIREDVKILREKIELAEALLRSAQQTFSLAAKEYSVVQLELEELMDAKKAIVDQLTSMMILKESQTAAAGANRKKFTSAGIIFSMQDINVLQSKIETLELAIASRSTSFGSILRKATLAQIDLEEAFQRKKVYSNLLLEVLRRNEETNMVTLLRIFREFAE